MQIGNKNSLHFKFTSLIKTAQLNDVRQFSIIVALSLQGQDNWCPCLTFMPFLVGMTVILARSFNDPRTHSLTSGS